MAKRSDHDVAGALAGGAAVVLSALAAGRTPSFAEVLGGTASGFLVSRVPDVVEPATHPGHRRLAHSAVALGAAGIAVPRLHGAHISGATAADREDDPVRRFLGRFAAGAAMGSAGGYASHLVLDATTPKGIPLLGL